MFSTVTKEGKKIKDWGINIVSIILRDVQGFFLLIGILKSLLGKLAKFIMHQSIPAAPSSPPPPPSPQANLRALAFFCLGWQILGGGDS